MTNCRQLRPRRNTDNNCCNFHDRCLLQLSQMPLQWLILFYLTGKSVQSGSLLGCSRMWEAVAAIYSGALSRAGWARVDSDQLALCAGRQLTLTAAGTPLGRRQQPLANSIRLPVKCRPLNEASEGPNICSWLFMVTVHRMLRRTGRS